MGEPHWHAEAIDRAANALVGALMDSCTVEEIEGTLAPIHPDDWKRVAWVAVDEYNRASIEIARRDLQRLFRARRSDTTEGA